MVVYQFLEELVKEQEKVMIYMKNLRNQVSLMQMIYLNLKLRYVSAK